MFRYVFTLIFVVCMMVPGNADADSLASGAPPGRAQLAAAWWQWAMSAPAGVNPVRDPTGANCAIGQQGSVWFLAGGFGSAKIHRVCTVPAGKTLFFPLINMVYWPGEEPVKPYTCDESKARAALDNDTALDLFAEVDGVAIDGLRDSRAASDGCFDVFKRIPPAQRPSNGYPAATDGYWLSINALQPGRHSLKFGGMYNHNSPQYGHMVQDIEYELIVQ